ncbi:hypothetical protein IGI04_039875, partial [Brassica rapa subsp. trilocularis]
AATEESIFEFHIRYLLLRMDYQQEWWLLEDFTMDINKMAATKCNSAVRSCSDVVTTTT